MYEHAGEGSIRDGSHVLEVCLLEFSCIARMHDRVSQIVQVLDAFSQGLAMRECSSEKVRDSKRYPSHHARSASRLREQRLEGDGVQDKRLLGTKLDLPTAIPTQSGQDSLLEVRAALVAEELVDPREAALFGLP
jgi:hypothetical protein